MILNREPYSHRRDDLVPDIPRAGPITVMDAGCALCARGAAWIDRNDRAAEFTIIPAQSRLGAALLTHYGLDPADLCAPPDPEVRKRLPY